MDWLTLSDASFLPSDFHNSINHVGHYACIICPEFGCLLLQFLDFAEIRNGNKLVA